MITKVSAVSSNYIKRNKLHNNKNFKNSEINFTSNKNKKADDVFYNAMNSFAKATLLAPSSQDNMYGIEFYSYLNELITSFKSVKKIYSKTKDESKKDFLFHEQKFKNLQDEGWQNVLLANTDKNMRLVLSDGTIMQYRKNLTLANDTIVPSYAISSHNGHSTIYDFDSKIAISDFFKDESGHESAKAIHVFDYNTKSDNIYSKIANFLGAKITINNPEILNDNEINADSILTYCNDKNNELLCINFITKPYVYTYTKSQKPVIESENIVDTFKDESVSGIYNNARISPDKYSNKKMTYDAKIEVLLDKYARNYGLYTFKDRKNPFFATRYINLDD